MNKIQELLSSPIAEDIAIGLKLLIKEKKPRKVKEFEDLISNYEFNPQEDVDIFVGNFNVVLYKGCRNSIAYWRTVDELDNCKVIRL